MKLLILALFFVFIAGLFAIEIEYAPHWVYLAIIVFALVAAIHARHAKEKGITHLNAHNSWSVPNLHEFLSAGSRFDRFSLPFHIGIVGCACKCVIPKLIPCLLLF